MFVNNDYCHCLILLKYLNLSTANTVKSFYVSKFFAASIVCPLLCSRLKYLSNSWINFHEKYHAGVIIYLKAPLFLGTASQRR